MIAQYQPATLAAMEGLFQSQDGAPLAILGQPDVPKQRARQSTHHSQHAQLPHLPAMDRHTFRVSTDFRRSEWPDNIPLLYFSYHIMVGLGTIFIAILVLSPRCCFCAASCSNRASMLWALMLALPFPFIANTAGWITAEVGRQPWLIYGLMRTRAGVSPRGFRRKRLVHADRFPRACTRFWEFSSCFWSIAKSNTAEPDATRRASMPIAAAAE